MVESIHQRLATHTELSAWLANQTDDDLVTLIQRAEAHEGWGTSRTLTIGDSNVFCKCIPLTKIQADDPYSTANLHRLPAHYHYGVGSAGFSPFRELAVHRKTTQWVLDGETVHVPLLHHHRILPLASQGRRMDGERLDRYVRFWDDDEQIRAYVEARNASTQTLVTFAEWVPHTFDTWLGHHQYRIDDVIEQIDDVISLLRQNDIVHFDVNPSNIVTDGTTMLLTDFGLALDAGFELEAEEQDFLVAHRHFDQGEFLACLDLPLHLLTQSWDDETSASMAERYGSGPVALLTNLEAVLADGMITIDPAYVAALLRYRPVITAMANVFVQLAKGPKDAAVYDDDVLVRLLGQVDDLEAGAGSP